MTQLGKFEKYLIEEFFDDFRAGAMSQLTFTRRVAFITGSMAAASAAMLLVGCTPQEVPRSTDPMPTPSPSSGTATGIGSGGAVPGAKSPLSVPEGAAGITTTTVKFPSGGTEISGYLARPAAGKPGPAVLICHENRGLTPHIEDVARRFAKEGYAALAIDLLSREGGTASLDPDAVPGALTQAGAQRHVADFSAGFDYLQKQEFVEQGPDRHDRDTVSAAASPGSRRWRSPASRRPRPSTARRRIWTRCLPSSPRCLVSTLSWTTGSPAPCRNSGMPWPPRACATSSRSIPAWTTPSTTTRGTATTSSSNGRLERHAGVVQEVRLVATSPAVSWPSPAAGPDASWASAFWRR